MVSPGDVERGARSSVVVAAAGSDGAGSSSGAVDSWAGAGEGVTTTVSETTNVEVADARGAAEVWNMSKEVERGSLGTMADDNGVGATMGAAATAVDVSPNASTTLDGCSKAMAAELDTAGAAATAGAELLISGAFAAISSELMELGAADATASALDVAGAASTDSGSSTGASDPDADCAPFEESLSLSPSPPRSLSPNRPPFGRKPYVTC